jgi:hypothetical protein
MVHNSPGKVSIDRIVMDSSMINFNITDQIQLEGSSYKDVAFAAYAQGIAVIIKYTIPVSEFSQDSAEYAKHWLMNYAKVTSVAKMSPLSIVKPTEFSKTTVNALGSKVFTTSAHLEFGDVTKKLIVH